MTWQRYNKNLRKSALFGGIFFVLDKFDRILSSVIDSHLGLRSKLIGYQYSKIIRAVFSVFCCGGDWIIRNRPRFFTTSASWRPPTSRPSVTSATLATAPPNVPTSQNRSTVLSLRLLRQRRNDWRSIGNSTK